MEEEQSCRNEKIFNIQFLSLKEDLTELKERVDRLEQTLTRGLILLVANLAGVIVTLMRQLI
jgi:hypothetical protein